MDTNEDDLNEDFKKENIEITPGSKISSDDDEVDGADDTDPALAEKIDIAENLSDDELDSDKMDFEPEEKDYM